MQLPANLRLDAIDDAGDLMAYWANLGWSVIPLNGKTPLTPNGIKDATRDPATIREWGRRWPNANVGGSCKGKLVIDVDVRSGGEWPEDLPVTRKHLSGRGDGGGHLIYALTDAQRSLGIKSGTSVLGEGVDVKTGTNSYIVLPGSVHPDTGKRYTENTDPVVHAPDDLIARIEAMGGSSEGGAQVRSLLSSLLANPPTEGGRNEWLAKVCGHYAKAYRTTPDLYWTHVRLAGAMTSPPMDPSEIAKTGESMWNRETSGHPERDFMDTLSEDSGWLAPGDYCLMTAGQEGTGENTQVVPVEFAQFDLKLQGILRDPEDESLTYDMTMLIKQTRQEVPIAITGEEFGDPRTLRRKLAMHGGILTGTERLVHRTPDWAGKLHLYVRSQEAPTMLLAPYLGWNEDEGGYVTLEGVIDRNGPRDYVTSKPDPALRKRGVARQSYGTAATPEVASDALARAMTFQDEDTTAIFGSWWAANWVKHLILRHSSMFPAMAIEAASGTGKTTGFFSTMVGLSGSTAGEGHYTMPTLRNALSVNYNGITWVDDLDDPGKVHEMVRVLTAGGSLTKMNSNHEPVYFHLVGSLILSGESLGLRDQKALRERVVLLEPMPPTDRTSQIPGREGQSQWFDILELRNELEAIGGPQALAGHFMQAVAEAEDEIEAMMLKMRGSSLGQGRNSDRAFALLVGARVLEYLLDPSRPSLDKGEGGEIYARVARLMDEDSPAARKARLDAGQVDGPAFEGDNTLTTEILPAYFADHGSFETLYRTRRGFIKESEQDGSVEVWFSPKGIAEWWADRNRGMIDMRVASADALVAQARQVRDRYPDEVMARSRARVGRGKDAPVREFWRMTGDPAKAVYLRSLQ